jgi:hypothetical protein
MTALRECRHPRAGGEPSGRRTRAKRMDSRLRGNGKNGEAFEFAGIVS